ncbi:MAG: ABC transporter permease [Candidatus Aminicenantes bacterium]|nr:ABC transporter permease [Candidatus Aminicenantes bacterium]
MTAATRRPPREGLLTAPSFVWLTVLFALPTILVFAIALRNPDPDGGIGAGWTAANLGRLAGPGTAGILWRTLWISAATSLICTALAVPVGYVLARVGPRWRVRLLMLVVVPFWTSFLIRVFAWKDILHPEGPVKRLLAALGLAGPQTSLLYSAGAVVLVSVYAYLPFMILPIYAAAEKFDFRLMEAARDLGARRWRAFRTVFLPGIRRGLWTGLLFVLIPSLGSYIIPDIVGGPSNELLGNKIAQRVFVDRNLPQAGALSVVLMLAVIAPLAAALILERRKRRPGGLFR